MKNIWKDVQAITVLYTYLETPFWFRPAHVLYHRDSNQQPHAQAAPEESDQGDQGQVLGSGNPNASGSKSPAASDEHDDASTSEDGSKDDESEEDGSENGEIADDSEHEPVADEAASDPESEQPVNHDSGSDSETTLILGECRSKSKDVAPTASDSGSDSDSDEDGSQETAEDLCTPPKRPEWREDMFTSPYHMGNSGPPKREILETCIELMQYFGDNYPEIRKYLGWSLMIVLLSNKYGNILATKWGPFNSWNMALCLFHRHDQLVNYMEHCEWSLSRFHMRALEWLSTPLYFNQWLKRFGQLGNKVLQTIPQTCCFRHRPQNFWTSLLMYPSSLFARTQVLSPEQHQWVASKSPDVQKYQHEEALNRPVKASGNDIFHTFPQNFN